MNIKILFGKFLILLISISMLFCSCGKTSSTDGLESQTDDKDTWKVALSGILVDVKVIEYEYELCLSVTDMLLACGYSFDWESEDVARIVKNDQWLTYNRKEKTLVPDTPIKSDYDTCGNRIEAGTGGTFAYIFSLDGDLFADYVIIHLILWGINESYGCRMNSDEKIIRYVTLEQAEQERAERESME